VSFDANAFAGQLTRALSPDAVPAVVEPVKCCDPISWRAVVNRDRDGLIASVDLLPVARITLPD
jgi:hypothetical protein